MQALLSDACQQHPKPTLALVGATIQEGLSGTAASMVSYLLAVHSLRHLFQDPWWDPPFRTALQAPLLVQPIAWLQCTA